MKGILGKITKTWSKGSTGSKVGKQRNFAGCENFATLQNFCSAHFLLFSASLSSGFLSAILSSTWILDDRVGSTILASLTCKNYKNSHKMGSVV